MKKILSPLFIVLAGLWSMQGALAKDDDKDTEHVAPGAHDSGHAAPTPHEPSHPTPHEPSHPAPPHVNLPGEDLHGHEGNHPPVNHPPVNHPPVVTHPPGNDHAGDHHNPGDNHHAGDDHHPGDNHHPGDDHHNPGDHHGDFHHPAGPTHGWEHHDHDYHPHPGHPNDWSHGHPGFGHWAHHDYDDYRRYWLIGDEERFELREEWEASYYRVGYHFCSLHGYYPDTYLSCPYHHYGEYVDDGVYVDAGTTFHCGSADTAKNLQKVDVVLKDLAVTPLFANAHEFQAKVKELAQMPNTAAKTDALMQLAGVDPKSLREKADFLGQDDKIEDRYIVAVERSLNLSPQQSKALIEALTQALSGTDSTDTLVVPAGESNDLSL